MSDLISRQEALDGIEQFRPIKPTRGETSMEAVNRSAWECAINCVESFVRTMPPSVEPEIIHCKDCRYRKTLQFFGRTEDFCGRHESFVELDDFCSAAQFEDDWMKYTE